MGLEDSHLHVTLGFGVRFRVTVRVSVRHLPGNSVTCKRGCGGVPPPALAWATSAATQAALTSTAPWQRRQSTSPASRRLRRACRPRARPPASRSGDKVRVRVGVRVRVRVRVGVRVRVRVTGRVRARVRVRFRVRGRGRGRRACLLRVLVRVRCRYWPSVPPPMLWREVPKHRSHVLVAHPENGAVHGAGEVGHAQGSRRPAGTLERCKTARRSSRIAHNFSAAVHFGTAAGGTSGEISPFEVGTR